MNRDNTVLVSQAIALLDSHSFAKKIQGFLLVAHLAAKEESLQETRAQLIFWHQIQHFLVSIINMDFIMPWIRPQDLKSIQVLQSVDRSFFLDGLSDGLRLRDLSNIDRESIDGLFDPTVSEDFFEKILVKLTKSQHVTEQDLKRLANLTEYAKAMSLSSEDQNRLLLRLIRDSRDSLTRSLCVTAISINREAYSIEKLAKLTGDKDPQVRLAATIGLCYLGQSDATEYIERSLNDDSPANTLTALYTLAHIQTKESLDVLKSVLKSGVTDLRIDAALALGSLKKNKIVIDLLIKTSHQEADPSVRKAIFKALGRVIWPNYYSPSPSEELIFALSILRRCEMLGLTEAVNCIRQSIFTFSKSYERKEFEKAWQIATNNSPYPTWLAMNEAEKIVKIEVNFPGEIHIHARPAQYLIRFLRRFESKIVFIVGEEAINAKSGIDLMQNASTVTSITVHAQGKDSEEFISKISEFLLAQYDSNEDYSLRHR